MQRKGAGDAEARQSADEKLPHHGVVALAPHFHLTLPSSEPRPPYKGDRESSHSTRACGSPEEVFSLGVERAQAVIEGACRRLREGGVPEEELRISTALRRDNRDYRTKAPHVAAAEALEIAGNQMEVGSLVDYVYVDAGHRNPFRRLAGGVRGRRGSGKVRGPREGGWAERSLALRGS